VVRRALGDKPFDYLDPFLMLDHMGPVTYAPGEGVGAPDHPHRKLLRVCLFLRCTRSRIHSIGCSFVCAGGFETVTYLLQVSVL
jgi:hypothetical protein